MEKKNILHENKRITNKFNYVGRSVFLQINSKNINGRYVFSHILPSLKSNCFMPSWHPITKKLRIMQNLYWWTPTFIPLV